ncbi:chromosome partitioning protein [Pilimelia terevasa]|uniref:non-specific protein-tyrosine kinase n=1 Tax=Pilimelia terevasa TaxID=53372 RepID=A0A8J3BLK3_9ACTN|nr:polysaccharide biosynthesis tyrosine autokinase [Pilimelia terevasa]GGK29921.1 chromosome partitioning protein [Pilimelia terevasa]
MNVRDVLRVLRKRWWWVLGAVTAALCLAALITVKTTPRYQTSVTFFVTTPNSGVGEAYEGGLFSQARVKSYAALLTSDRLSAAVSRKSNTGLTPAEVRDRVRAEPNPDTVLLDATVTDESQQRARLLATHVAAEFKALVELLETQPGRPQSSVKVEVVAGPTVNDTPVAPQPVRNFLVAGLLGLLLGASAATMRELLDTTVKTNDALAEAAGAPVLAAVPVESALRDTPHRLVTAMAHTPRAEALRQLRTNLQFVDVDRPVRTVVVTSAIAGEGKSSTACNLATLFAEAGKRVLLVDADLRRPRVAEYLGIEGAAGLTTLLAGQARLDDVAQEYGTGMWVLPSGFQPPNPSELLGSAHMADLLEDFRERYDLVIVDCPPLLPVTDGAVVAARADGALLVTRARQTTQAQVHAAAGALRSVDARLLGCVFNMVMRSDGDPYQYYGYGYGAPGQAGARSLVDDLSAPEEPRGVPVSAGR